MLRSPNFALSGLLALLLPALAGAAEVTGGLYSGGGETGGSGLQGFGIVGGAFTATVGASGATQLAAGADPAPASAASPLDNTIPVAADVRVAVREGGRITAPLTGEGRDADGDALSIQLIDAPAHGVLESVEGGVRYTHDGSESTTDSWQYRLFDGLARSLPARVDVTITPINDPPEIASQQQVIRTRAAQPFTLTLDAFAITDPDSDELVLQPRPGAGYTLSGNEVVPEADVRGTLAVTLIASDGAAASPPFTAEVRLFDDPPSIVAPAGMRVAATGWLTSVELGEAMVTDLEEPDLGATPTPGGPFRSGRHRIEWRATDLSGQSAVDNQTLTVLPRVFLGPRRVERERDGELLLPVYLSDRAPEYPVEIELEYSGTATAGLDFTAPESVTIAAGTVGGLPLRLLADARPEGPETLDLRIVGATGAAAGERAHQRIELVERNTPPKVSLAADQNGPRRHIDPDGGLVTVLAEVADPDPDESWQYDWSATDTALIDLDSDAGNRRFEFDPAGLPDGVYSLHLTVTDATLASGTAELMLRVLPPPALDPSLDSDGDGVDDATEGAGDADFDGIPDYRDPSTQAWLLPADPRVPGGLLMASPGTRLALGGFAFVTGQAGAKLPPAILPPDRTALVGGPFDYELRGIAPGAIARIVLPLERELPPGAQLRKFGKESGWRPFSSAGGDGVASAPARGNTCPFPGSPAYAPGLAPGATCVELTLTDGGANDADGRADGVIRDPVAVMESPSRPGGSGLVAWKDLLAVALLTLLIRVRAGRNPGALHRRRPM